MNAVMSGRREKVRRWPLGTWVICPRHDGCLASSAVSSSQILTMNGWVLPSDVSTVPTPVSCTRHSYVLLMATRFLTVSVGRLRLVCAATLGVLGAVPCTPRGQMDNRSSDRGAGERQWWLRGLGTDPCPTRWCPTSLSGQHRPATCRRDFECVSMRFNDTTIIAQLGPCVNQETLPPGSFFDGESAGCRAGRGTSLNADLRGQEWGGASRVSSPLWPGSGLATNWAYSLARYCP